MDANLDSANAKTPPVTPPVERKPLEVERICKDMLHCHVQQAPPLVRQNAMWGDALRKAMNIKISPKKE